MEDSDATTGLLDRTAYAQAFARLLQLGGVGPLHPDHAQGKFLSVCGESAGDARHCAGVMASSARLICTKWWPANSCVVVHVDCELARIRSYKCNTVATVCLLLYGPHVGRRLLHCLRCDRIQPARCARCRALCLAHEHQYPYAATRTCGPGHASGAPHRCAVACCKAHTKMYFQQSVFEIVI